MKSVQDYLHTKDEHIMCRKASLFIFILGVKSKLEKVKGVFAKNERGYTLNAIKKRFLSH